MCDLFLKNERQEPEVSLNDFLKSLQSTKPSVGQEDLEVLLLRW